MIPKSEIMNWSCLLRCTSKDVVGSLVDGAGKKLTEKLWILWFANWLSKCLNLGEWKKGGFLIPIVLRDPLQLLAILKIKWQHLQAHSCQYEPPVLPTKLLPKCKNSSFSATQILREINFRHFISFKTENIWDFESEWQKNYFKVGNTERHFFYLSNIIAWILHFSNPKDPDLCLEA